MKVWRYIFFILFLVLALVVISIFQLPDKNLHVIACDVGQGDAVLVVYKDFQILTDGGPDTKVLSCLGRHLPFWDRTIEAVILTHPDSDHLTGLTEVINRYKVGKLVINPADPGTPLYRLLQNRVGSRDITVVDPTDITDIGWGLIYLDILHPNIKVISPGVSSREESTNQFSVVYLLGYGGFRALMLGDITPAVSDALAANWTDGSVDYIKIPHHGSKEGLTQNLLEKTSPKVGVISVGKDNDWGFPAESILQMLAKYDVKVLRTDLSGDVEIITDGTKVWTKN